MDKFKLVSPFKPTGDQPEAIEALTRGILAGAHEQTLLGVTGSGKTFTMANIIERVNRPTLICLLYTSTLVLAYNPISGNWSARSPISLSISEDNGNTFSQPVHLETKDGEFSYPAILADGSHIYMTYTYKRKSIIFCTFDIIE